MSKGATEREVRLARAFLKAMGGDQANGYLLYAVIVWGRAQGKAHDKFWKSLSHYGAAEAGRRLALHLKSRIKQRPGMYKDLVKALKRRKGSDTDQQGVALDFLVTLSKSDYDPHHYGYVEGSEGGWHWVPPYYDFNGGGYIAGHAEYQPPVLHNDPMAQAWATLTNYLAKHPLPPKWFSDPTVVQKQKTIPPRPSQPRSLAHVLPSPEYIQPYAAVHFYDARPHIDRWVLPPVD